MILIEKIFWKNIFETPYASIWLPYDEKICTQCENLSNSLREKSNTLVLIGIGGSNLGTWAIYDALKMHTDKEIIFCDTVDSYDVLERKEMLEKKLKLGENIIVTVISKSGGTIETIALFEYFLSEFHQYKEQISIVVITDTGSKLENLAREKNWEILNIPKNVGGRYSVFSHVWLFPLAFVGIHIRELLTWAKQCLEDYKKNPETHSSTLSAEILFENYPKRTIIEHFFFSKRFENIGKWYRQLLAESVGKIKETWERIWLTPTTAIGTIDLHSIAQLQFSKTDDRSIFFIWEHWVPKIQIEGTLDFPSIVLGTRTHTFEQMMDTALQATEIVAQKAFIPTFRYSLQFGNTFDIGYFLQTKMLEVILLGELFKIDSFNQAQVELYKIEMRKIFENL